MQSFAVKQNRATPAVRKARPVAVRPKIAASSHQQAEMRSILQSTDAQAKLTIGQANDKYEQEADRVADHVVAGRQAPQISSISSSGNAAPISREANETAAAQSEVADQTMEEEKEPEDEAGLYLLQPTMAADAADDEDEESVQAKLIQRQAEDAEEYPVQAKLIQRQAEEEEEPVQAKLIQRQTREEDEEPVQAKAEAPSLKPASAVVADKSGGQPIRADVCGRIESSLGTDLSGVRVHEDASAQQAAKSIQARAFTHQNDIWLGEGESQSDLHLMAHEATHVLQQGGVARRKPVSISQTSPRIQRSWLGDAWNSVSSAVGDAAAWVGETVGDALGFVKNKAVEFVQVIPGYSLFTVFMGKDPITDETVERSGRNFIEAGLDVIPDGGELKQKLEEEGKIAEAAEWLDEQINMLDISPTEIGAQLSRFWDNLGIEDVARLGELMTELSNIFMGPIQRLVSFAVAVGDKLFEIFKNIMVGKLVDYARTIRGYPLLTVILGQDPFSEEPVERSAENIIHGFMSLMDGGEEQFQEMKQTGAIDRMTARLETAIATLNFTWEYIRGLFITAWDSFGFPDFANPFDAFQRVVAIFSEPISQLFGFIVIVIRIVIEVALKLMNFPVALISNIIAKSMQAFDNIKRDPIGFLKNLLRAVKTGFVKFFDNITTHLINGVTSWLFGQLEDAGITPPPDLSFQSILGLVMQILGITMDKIFAKLAEKIGPEKVDRIRGMMDRLTGIWAFVSDVMTRGPVAIWEYVKEKLNNLWDMVLDSVRNWVVTKIVQQVTAKLLSMLDPTGIMAVVNGFIAFYNAIQSFVQYLTEMLQVVNSFVEGVAEIAAGSVQSAANYLENALGRAMPIAIGFLANQVGLGSLGRRIGEMIERVQAKVDEGLDWLIDKAVSAGTSFMNMVTGRGQNDANSGQESEHSPEKQAQIDTALEHVPQEEARLTSNGKISRSNAEQVAEIISQNYSVFSSFTVVNGGDSWDYRYTASPPATEQGIAKASEEDETNAGPEYGGRSNGYGTLVTVSLMVKNGTIRKPISGGTSTNSSSFEGGYRTLDKRMRGRLPLYVRGHLLNEGLGGSGTNWKNLTPLSKSGNALHSTRFESKVKGKLNEGKIIKNFKVQPIYGRTLNPFITALENPTRPLASGWPTMNMQKRREIADIMKEEVNVPDSLECSAEVWEGTSKESDIKPDSIPNRIYDTDINAYKNLK